MKYTAENLIPLAGSIYTNDKLVGELEIESDGYVRYGNEVYSCLADALHEVEWINSLKQGSLRARDFHRKYCSNEWRLDLDFNKAQEEKETTDVYNHEYINS